MVLVALTINLGPTSLVLIGALLTEISPYAPGPGFAATLDALKTVDPGATGANRDTLVLKALLCTGIAGAAPTLGPEEYDPGPGVIALVVLFLFSCLLLVLEKPA